MRENMANAYDVIVVGAGISGLTCAAYLVSNGYKTLVLEKSDKTGGLVNSFPYKGYIFDAGIRAFENSGILFPMLKNLGIDLEFIKSPVTIGIGNEIIEIKDAESLDRYLSLLKGLFPKNEEDIKIIGEEIRKVMGYMDILYGIENPLFLDHIDPKYGMNTLLPWYLKYLSTITKVGRLNEPVGEYLSRFTTNKELIDMIIQHFFKDTPTFFALSYFSLYLEYFYPKGGTGSLSKILTDFVTSKGGVIITKAPVSQIDVNKKEVILGEKRYSYRKLVWAADQKALYNAITDYQNPKADKIKETLSTSIGSDSILTLFIGSGLVNEYFQKHSGPHSFYTPKTAGLSSVGDWHPFIDNKEPLIEWIEKYLEHTTYELSGPALRDPELAPVGKTGILVSTLMDYHLVNEITKQGWYEEFKELCKKTIIRVLSDSIYPEFQDHIEFSLCGTPLTIEKETGNTHGAIVGWSFTNPVMPSVNNFKKIATSIKTPMKDIYQCGQWSFSPGGLPVSILTGKFAANAIHKKLK